MTHPTPEEISNKLIFEAPTPVKEVVDAYRALLEENKRLEGMFDDANRRAAISKISIDDLYSRLEQVEEENGMVNALSEADNLDLKSQLQQTREEMERARKSAKHHQDMRDSEADRLPNLITELEQVKAELAKYKGEVNE
jgi:chromosome segregation ATPase